ncbi:MAG: PEGA domain-containing protein [Candidatus Aenigmarchaeota archaeon]|nr:PEGA domain-containing protein [Candidatus Aenigmarchaeota archaeon]
MKMENTELILLFSALLLSFALFVLVADNNGPTGLAVGPSSGQIAALSATSDPSGAELFVDGVRRGVTPAKVDRLSPGTHTIRISKAGYTEYTASKYFSPGVTTPVFARLRSVGSASSPSPSATSSRPTPTSSRAPTPSAAGRAGLSVTSVPTGANVFVDNALKGQTGRNPLLIDGLSAGRHTIKLTKEAYSDYIITATLRTGVRQPVNARLKAASGTTPAATPSPGHTGTIPTPTPSATVSPTPSATLQPGGRAGLLVTSEPSDADVYVDDVPVGRTPARVERLREGVHSVMILKENYNDYTAQPYVREGQTVRVYAKLSMASSSPSGGRAALSVTSDPSNADVYVDDVLRGQTPIRIDRLGRGTHSVRVAKEGYGEYRTRVSLREGRTLPIHARLRPAAGSPNPTPSPSASPSPSSSQSPSPSPTATATATLSPSPSASPSPTTPTRGSIKVTSQPSDADVFVDYSPKGKTPATITGMRPGRHLVKVTKAEYVDVSQDVYVSAGEIATVDAALRRATGSLRITSTPAGADVVVSNIPEGKTPVELTGLSPGNYYIIVSMPDYRDFRQNPYVTAGEAAEVNAVLSRVTGDLGVTSEPTGANIYIDQELKGTTPATIERLRPGNHWLTVTKENYRESRQYVYVQAGLLVEANVVLQAQ